MNTQLREKDQKFMKSWEKQRANRFKYAFLHSILFSVVISVMLVFLNDFTFPKDLLSIFITFLILMAFNTAIQYYLNYSIMEERYQKLLKKKSVDDFN